MTEITASQICGKQPVLQKELDNVLKSPYKLEEELRSIHQLLQSYFRGHVQDVPKFEAMVWRFKCVIRLLSYYPVGSEEWSSINSFCKRTLRRLHELSAESTTGDLIKKVVADVDTQCTGVLLYDPDANAYSEPYKHRVVVIGSGPAGLASAIAAAKNKHNVVVYERYKSYDRPQVLSVTKPNVLELKRVTGVELYFDDYKEEIFTPENPQPLTWWAFSCNTLRKRLLREAEDLGIRIELAHAFLRFDRNEETNRTTAIVEDYTTGKVEAVDFDILVAADGANGVVRDDKVVADGAVRMIEIESGSWAAVGLYTGLEVPAEDVSGLYSAKDFSISDKFLTDPTDDPRWSKVKWHIKMAWTGESYEMLYSVISPYDKTSYDLFEDITREKFNYSPGERYKETLNSTASEHLALVVEKATKSFLLYLLEQPENKPQWSETWGSTDSCTFLQHLELKTKEEVRPFSTNPGFVYNTTVKIGVNQLLSIHGDAAHRPHFIAGSGTNGICANIKNFDKLMKKVQFTPPGVFWDEYAEAKSEHDREVCRNLFAIGLLYSRTQLLATPAKLFADISTTPAIYLQTNPSSERQDFRNYLPIPTGTVDAKPLQQFTWCNKESLILIVMGATGDLATKYLFPALLILFNQKDENGVRLLPANLSIVGTSDKALSSAGFRNQLLENKHYGAADIDLETKVEFVKRCSYVASGFRAENFDDLNKALEEKEAGSIIQNRIFHLAIAPKYFVQAARGISECARSKNGFTRVAFEKPFGADTNSAIKLAKTLAPLFKEETEGSTAQKQTRNSAEDNKMEMYMNDHFLMMNVTENLLKFRFFDKDHQYEQYWNNKYIESVLVNFVEDFGIDERAGYFDENGIIRDIHQNHLAQLLSLTLMKRPADSKSEPSESESSKSKSNKSKSSKSESSKSVIDQFDSKSLHEEKVKVLSALSFEAKDAAIGQYGASEEGFEPPHHAYLREKDVPPNSKAQTFASMVAYANVKSNKDSMDDWKGVPIALRCGKGVKENNGEIRIKFKNPDSSGPPELSKLPDQIVFRILSDKEQPEVFFVTRDGKEDPLLYKPASIPEWSKLYSHLCAIPPKKQLFATKEESIASWEIFTHFLHSSKTVQPDIYAFGSSGPDTSDRLLKDHNVHNPYK